MIQQRVGDVLEIQFDGKFYYVVVLTKIVMFGGNIVFAFHTDGSQQKLDDLMTSDSGFNICCDLSNPKRDGQVVRLHRFSDVTTFWKTRLVKATHEYRAGHKAKEWFIYSVDHLGGDHLARVAELTPDYRAAMDDGCHSFDLVVKKILARYVPSQNEFI